MLDYQIINIPLGGGVDLKKDPKTVRPDKSLALENATLQQIDTATKRHGYRALGKSIIYTSARAAYTGHSLLGLGDALMAAGGLDTAFNAPSALAWSDEAATWAMAGVITPFTVSMERGARQIPEPSGSSVQSYTFNTVAANEHFACYAAATYTNTDVYVVVVDRTTGARVIDTAAFPNTASWAGGVRAVHVDGSFLVFTKKNATTQLHRVIINTASLGTAVATAQQLSDLHAGDLWDVCENGTSAVMAYKEYKDSRIKVISLDSSGSVTALATLAVTPKNALTVFPATDASGNKRFIVVYQDNTTGFIDYYVLSTAGATIAGPATITVTTAAETVRALTGAPDQTGDGGPAAPLIRVFIDISESVPYLRKIRTNLATFAGAAIGAQYVMRAIELASKAFVYSGKPYILTRYAATSQPTYFVKSFAAADGVNDSQTHVKLLASAAGVGEPTVPVQNRFVSDVADLGGGDFLVSGLKQERRQTGGIIITSQVGFNLTAAQPLPSATLGGGSYIGGGVVQQFDGHVHESGFHLTPETDTANATFTQGAGGAIADGTYLYKVVAEYTDAFGQVHLSGTSARRSITIVGGGGTASLAIVVPALKEVEYYKAIATKLYAYRTKASGTTYYKCAETATSDGGVLNSKTTDVVTVTDTLSDSDLSGRQQLYTNGGVLADTAPPASSVCAAGKGRLWVVQADDPQIVWFSKAKIANEPARFSSFLTKRISSVPAITALGFWNDSVIVFAKKTIRYFTGPGPNDLGQPASDGGFSEDFLLSQDVGLRDRPSLVACDKGLVWMSGRGFYITNGGPPVYIGADVEAYNSYTVTSAVLIEDAHQLRFGLKDGPTLVYDYLVGQWSTFTIQSVSAALWQGKYAWLDAGGGVHVENDGYLDGSDPISMKWGTAWIRVGGMQGFQCCTRAYILGTFKSHHKLTLRVYVEADGYDPTIAAETATLDTREALGLSTGLYKFEHALAVQKFSAVRFEIEDSEQEGTGESYSLSGLALKVGLLPGSQRGSGSRSFVGGG